MINSIINILRDRNIIESSDLHDYNYFFNNRANINFFLGSRKENRPSLFMKISDLRDFGRTFENMKRVYGRLPQLVPEPVCMFSLGGYQVLVTKAYDFELLSSMLISSDKKRKALLENVFLNLTQLQLNTKEGHIVFDKDYYQQNLALKVHNFLEKWRDNDLKKELGRHMERLSKYYGTHLPCIPQHGDLVMFNAGLVDGKIDRIIFVDWDSYADIKLPMYDALIFFTAFLKFYGYDLYSGKTKLTRRICEAFFKYCDVIGLDRDLAVDFYPVCLFLFADTKADTGVYVGQEHAYREMKKFFEKKDQIILRYR